MDCQLVEHELGNGRSEYSCPNCSLVHEGRSGLTHAKRTCGGGCRETPGKEPLGLGDRAEILLKQFGVTQDRYLAAKAWLLGKMPEEVTCDCPARKEWLNKIGAEIGRLFG